MVALKVQTAIFSHYCTTCISIL